MEIYNTIRRDYQTFEPLQPGRVGMYVCGVTVYDLCHIGHARSAIVFDVLFRFLRTIGYSVTYVRNFTDIDDKIIDRANLLGVGTAQLAEKYIQAFYEDMDSLLVLRPSIEPRATHHIQPMIEMVQVLLSKGHAYVEEGDVYFSVATFPGYGELSGRRLEEMKAGFRVKVDEKKRHPLDFALWKSSKPNEPYWESPWGKGRPGWHLECSVMSNIYLGRTFDIHGGGLDLIFPHHENERAQSLCANGGQFARFWVHNGFVTVESEKMSKSLGNFITIRDAISQYHPEVLRLFLLSKHYRTPLDFSKEQVFREQNALLRIYRTLKRLEEIMGKHTMNLELEELFYHLQQVPGFLDSLSQDLNTPAAIAALFSAVKEVNGIMDGAKRQGDEASLRQLRDGILAAGKVLGILNQEPSQFFQEVAKSRQEIQEEEIERLIEERASARKAKDFKRADEIRDYLKSKGVILEDTPKGTKWRWDLS
jgi:cysteinyl-tRNA synthetase